jgi:hypothetical protein
MHDEFMIELDYERYEIFLDELFGEEIDKGEFASEIAYQLDLKDALGAFDE